MIVAAVFTLVLMFALGGKPYYAGAVFTVLFAAGAVRFERQLVVRRSVARGAWRGRRASMTFSMLASAAVAAPIALPVLPAAVLHTIALQKINYDLTETIGWPKLVSLVGHEYHSLPSAEQEHTAILTGNYGEAGAVDRYGASDGLPQAYSGQNNFWLFGPPRVTDTAVVAVDVDPALLKRTFAHVRRVATFYNGVGVSDDEQGAPLFLASGLQSSWETVWAEFRQYD